MPTGKFQLKTREFQLNPLNTLGSNGVVSEPAGRLLTGSLVCLVGLVGICTLLVGILTLANSFSWNLDGLVGIWTVATWLSWNLHVLLGLWTVLFLYF